MLKKVSKLSYISRRNFCIFAPYLNPERHINMSHNPQNCYEEIIQLGDYPIAPKTNDKVLSRKYEQPTLKLVVEFLKTKDVTQFKLK